MQISPRILDRAEQILLVSAGIWFFYRIWPDELTFPNLYTILLIISEGTILLFVLLRRPTENISIRFRDWVVALGASMGPLFVDASGYPIAYNLGLILLLLGMSIHIGAKLSLNFSFGIVAANRGVRQIGLYRLIRHPMYAGYIIAHSGFFLTAPSLRNFIIYSVVWSLFIARIFAEERILSQDPAYRALKSRVKYRLIPGLF